MLFKKKFLILCGIAIFLGLTLTIGTVFQAFQRNPIGEHSFLADTVELQTLDSLTITQGQKQLSFTKSNGTWYLGSSTDAIAVKQSRLDDFIKSLKAMRSLRIAAQSSQGYVDLKIDDTQATRVELVTGNSPITFWFGDVSQDGSEQFLREKGKDAVHAVKSGIGFWLQQEPKYWYDRQVWPDSVKPAYVLAISYQSS